MGLRIFPRVSCQQATAAAGKGLHRARGPVIKFCFTDFTEDCLRVGNLNNYNICMPRAHTRGTDVGLVLLGHYARDRFFLSCGAPAGPLLSSSSFGLESFPL